ncbi:His Kinase A (phospho-acceptor) domain-containing protein [Desulfatibacillum alkenivorans DSM 16219]|jgi:signal transduction histidine kinase|uniref:histidine kinase n=1 Tax=Desulfatibacillum alkenivorans DSM 16219 TaxID=1121393 RepID=A0A1M7ASZ9_9BACT|nr:response regulator [Desulfatibacillum alkenivorans]SHL45888.1 His Kinase A (phospho-acceptor) domain-containing protein [Desulfatibacillum alkenivorans DSM 16219]
MIFAPAHEAFRLLIIDDNSDIHNDFRTILTEKEETNSVLDAMEMELFGEAPAECKHKNKYELDFALQGKEGLDKVHASILEGNPYAVAFVDMRMPPGWDGLETIERIWQVDPHVQMVICSAYSDYSWQEIIERLGRTDSLLILKKPFDAAEVAQLASALSEKWKLAKQASLKMVQLEGMVQERTQELAYANEALQHEIKERKSAETALRHAQKMEAIGTLAGGIAHDFNNILFGAMGFAEIALGDAEPGTRIHKSLDQIINAHKRAARLVDQILSFSRQIEHEPQVIHIHPVIKEALSLLRSTIPSTVEIRKEIDVQCGAVMADPTKIYQVIMNLCTNASHAMEDAAGVLEVTLKEVDVPEHEAAFMQIPAGKYARLTVKDNGMGMDQETQNRVFEPYFTTKLDGHGNGLGLATTYGIVKHHKGAIQVDSRRGQGTTFNVFFPIVKEQAKVNLDDLVVAAPAAGDKHILVVDDEKPIILMEEATLVQWGYEVTSTTDSQEALRLFMENPHSYDAVVTDQTMPKLTGIDLAREMLKVRPDLPIILVTGYSAAVTRQKAPDLGLAAYLEKPVETMVLAQAVDQAISSRNAVQAGVAA